MIKFVKKDNINQVALIENDNGEQTILDEKLKEEKLKKDEDKCKTQSESTE